MANTERYKSAGAFRRALEDRLKVLAQQENIALDRLRRRVCFDRLLSRLFDTSKPNWILKGGYALEYRFGNIARATKDIDFTIPHLSNPTAEKIQAVIGEESKKEKGDWFSFLIGAAMADLTQAVYAGWRYPVEARLDNRIFSKFHIDVGVGDAIISEPEWQKGSDILAFAGIPPAFVALLPRDQQFAEKIHAYTLPRADRLNSRTRDLVDMVLLIEHGLPEENQVLKAVQATFKRRKTHSPPLKLEPPPAIWKATYEEMAEECGVSKKTMEGAFKLLEHYWNKLFHKKNQKRGK